MGYHFSTEEDFASKLDDKDPLAVFKNRFYRLEDSIYMDGNSLGLMSVDAEKSLLRIVEEWKTLGIKGWTGGKIPWIIYAEKLGEMQAPLVGAEPEEVVVTGGTTVNLSDQIEGWRP
jgi:kynureninase